MRGKKKKKTNSQNDNPTVGEAGALRAPGVRWAPSLPPKDNKPKPSELVG